jgi:hypothetical protein
MRVKKLISFRQPNSTQFDYGNQIKQPLQLLTGGYIGAFDVSSGTGWYQIAAEGSAFKFYMRPRLGSRRERRRTPRDQWLPSQVKAQ